MCMRSGTMAANFDGIVVGGGAAGMMAAIFASMQGSRVLLLERNDRLGKKLLITGKGRCNVTNCCAAEEVLANTPRNSRFLYSAMTAFPPRDVMAFFEKLGCDLKVERGNRVFPVSDRSASVLDALKGELRRRNVTVRTARVSRILTEAGTVCGVETENGSFRAQWVILATGGASYPLTGSTGDGYRMAQELGHTVTPLRASLVPLVCEGKDCPRLQGLSLRNVGLTVQENGKTLYEDFGEMLFTHYGVSGPLILRASSHMRKWEKARYSLEIDLKPALDEQTLDRRIVSDFSEHLNADFRNALGALLPKKLIPIIVERSGIDPHAKVNSITKQQRAGLVHALKHFALKVVEPRPIEEAIVTSGGVSVREIAPRDMQSKKVRGLYFAGEIIDVDAYTGGFNLQIAWSTGYLAGSRAAEIE